MFTPKSRVEVEMDVCDNVRWWLLVASTDDFHSFFR